ncbi:EamA family transporter [Pelagibaculum spongiae]|uniref:EamA family transporter n=1 Tax=Pelagibaculum spongiae TaxID=2080658 RepID=A0A2V1GTW2_9GAMM|nr:EamA family transporter [Pelagibaculum spongiae]
MQSDAILMLTAAIWGFAFVAQRVGMEHLGPFSFNGIRFLMGSLALLPLLWLLPDKKPHPTSTPKGVWFGGLALGLLLFCGASLQQVGLQYTTAGKAGFITGLYIVLVPVIGLFFAQKTRSITWFGALIALAGLYFLTIEKGSGINKGDVLELIGSVFWAAHVLLVGWLAPKHNTLTLSSIQFAVCGVLSLAVALPLETITIDAIGKSWLPLAYAGLMSTAIAYTLQIVGQKKAPAAHASIILSLEAVFAVLGGWLLLDEHLTERALIGCGLMMAGMLISQDLFFKKNRAKPSV